MSAWNVAGGRERAVNPLEKKPRLKSVMLEETSWLAAGWVVIWVWNFSGAWSFL